ncbi:uncharacterized protein PS065_017414 isoform 2-T2 [Dugong dugon]
MGSLGAGGGGGGTHQEPGQARRALPTTREDRRADEGARAPRGPRRPQSSPGRPSPRDASYPPSGWAAVHSEVPAVRVAPSCGREGSQPPRASSRAASAPALRQTDRRATACLRFLLSPGRPSSTTFLGSSFPWLLSQALSSHPARSLD